MKIQDIRSDLRRLEGGASHLELGAKMKAAPISYDAKMPPASRNSRMTLRQYRALANFRYELRRFLRYSEQVTRLHGLTPLQYQLLLQIKGFPRGQRATIGELAERLQAKHHGVVALATRCENLGLIRRQSGRHDRRVVYLALTAQGNRILASLARRHRDELRSRRNCFIAPLK